MRCQYEVEGNWVIVEITEGLVRITNDDAFKRAVVSHPSRSVTSLIGFVQTDYAALHQTALAIGYDSLAVEIWAHLYFEYFLLKYRKLSRFIFLFGLYNRFLRSCEIIDCGERGKDRNRWIWDKMARYRFKIESWLPKIHSWLVNRQL